MIKKIVSCLLTFIMLMILTSLGCLLVARSFLVGSKTQLLETQLLQKAKDTTDMRTEIFEETFKNTGIPLEVIDYMDEQETIDYVDTYLKEYIKYQLGLTNYPKLNNKELQNIVNSAVKEYEKMTKKKVKTTTFYEVINALDTERKKEGYQVEYPEITNIIQAVYDKEAFYLLITLFLICSFLLLLVNKFKDVIKYFSSMFTLNGVGLLLLSFALNNYLKQSSYTIEIGKEVSHLFNIFSFVSIDIGLVLFLLLVLLKQLKKYKEKKQREFMGR